VTIPIDVARLPGPAQKILDPHGPAPLKGMAAKGLVPGLKPGETLAVVIVLSQGDDAHATAAKATLEKLPTPLINGALGQPDLQPGVLDVLGVIFRADVPIAEKIVLHPAVAPETIEAMATVGTEGVCEIIATNEERLLKHPTIIEKLYLNKHCRMSTADRVLELAVRNDLTLNIPAFAQAAQAIKGELISEATEEASFDDQQFGEANDKAAELRLEEGEDTHVLNEDTGQEEVSEKAKPLHAIWAELRPPAKIRLLQLATMKLYDPVSGQETADMRFDQKALRMLGVRDANPLVACSALHTPGISDGEIEKIASMRNVVQEVLNEIAGSKEWTRHYMVKLRLVMNPRTPFGHASKFVLHMRESDLAKLAKSKEVPGAVQTACRQQLQRKGKV
jgi:hypothetical protein